MTIALDIWCIYLVLFLLQERIKSFSNSMEGNITTSSFKIVSSEVFTYSPDLIQNTKSGPVLARCLVYGNSLEMHVPKSV
jgi:hypothetical protein